MLSRLALNLQFSFPRLLKKLGLQACTPGLVGDFVLLLLLTYLSLTVSYRYMVHSGRTMPPSLAPPHPGSLPPNKSPSHFYVLLFCLCFYLYFGIH